VWAENAGESSAEGGYCRLVQRRLSALVSPRLARRLEANTVTAIDLLVGLAAALSVVLGQYLLGAVLVQAFGVLSCTDGEVARIRGETSDVGDFVDTMTDRAVEVALVAAVSVRLYRDGEGPGVLVAGLALMAAVLLLVVSSEKFRSAFRVRYPKGAWEKGFTWVSAGSDARLLVLTCGLFGSAVVDGPRPMLVALVGLAGGAWLNVIWRVVMLARRLSKPATTDGRRFTP